MSFAGMRAHWLIPLFILYFVDAQIYFPFAFKPGPISEVSKQPRQGELTFIEEVSKLQVCK